MDGRDLEAKLREAAGWQSQPAPNLAVTGEIEALIAAGAILETDVLPVVKAHAPRVRRPSSWRYFVPIIRDAMESRMQAGRGPPLDGEVVPFPPTQRNANGHHQNSRSRNFAILDAIVAEAERRENEGGGGGG